MFSRNLYMDSRNDQVSDIFLHMDIMNVEEKYSKVQYREYILLRNWKIRRKQEKGVASEQIND